MKNTKKLLAMLSALTLSACCLAPVAMNVSAEDTASITIEGISTAQTHTFEVYQVFTGELDAEKKFTNLKWGSDVTQYNNENVKSGDLVDPDTVIALENGDARAIADNLILATTGFKTMESSNGTATLTGLADGYYVIKDVTDLSEADDANSSWIVQVAGSSTVAIKNAKPTVDKQVLDEIADAEIDSPDGWGESADHAINETFQFKLTATIPADENLTAYDTYKLVFHDKMSNGVTFDSIASVDWLYFDKAKSRLTWGGELLNNDNYIDYTETATNAKNKAGLDWTLTIDNLKSIVTEKSEVIGSNVFGKEEITVEVIYNAHLNENAVVDKNGKQFGTTDDTNNNSVYLEYSNNPDNFGEGDKQPTETGKTPKDYVWVFTYGVDNTKYAVEKADGNELAGAEFSLHNAKKNGEIDNDSKIKVNWNEDRNAYVVAKEDDDSATTVLESQNGENNKGTFNILGLDAGTYYLVEDNAPAGYNEIEPLKIVISAGHMEEGETVALTFSSNKCEGMTNDIVDTRTSQLPSTGGIGTTLFYLGGGCMVAVSGILLISKKRMGKREN